MFAPATHADAPSPFRRFIAALGVALVLLLGVAAVNPVVHAHLHEADHAGHDGAPAASPHVCAVELFASGIAFALAATAVASPRLAWHERPPVALAELYLTPPRYLRQPERGPPV